MNEICSYIGKHCTVRRDGDSIVCLPINDYNGVKLSDERLKILFVIYADLLRKQKLEEEDNK